MHVYVYVLSCSVMSNSLRLHGPWRTRLLCPWNFPGKYTGVGCHFLLQEIFPTQEFNPGLLYFLNWQADSSTLASLGKLHVCVCVCVRAHKCLLLYMYFFFN